MEFLGRSSFLPMWFAGLLFFLANCLVLGVVLWQHRFKPVFVAGVCTSIEEREQE